MTNNLNCLQDISVKQEKWLKHQTVWKWTMPLTFSAATGDPWGWVPAIGQCRPQCRLWQWNRSHLFGVTCDHRSPDWWGEPFLWGGQTYTRGGQRAGSGGDSGGHGGGHCHDNPMPVFLPGLWDRLGSPLWTCALWKEELLPGEW